MKKSEFTEVVNASVEATWEVLFSQYGEIHVHNPNMPKSSYLGSDTKGGLNCARRCWFDDKLWLDEKITAVDEHRSFKVEAYNHNLPMMKDMAAIYELTPVGQDKTKITMTSMAGTSPGFMIYLVKGTLGKGLKQHLFGLKYYLETGKTVNKQNYAEVFKNYN